MADTLTLAADLTGAPGPLQFEHPLTGQLVSGTLVAGSTTRYELVLPGVSVSSPFTFKLGVGGQVFTSIAKEILDLRPVTTFFNTAARTYELKGPGTALVSEGWVHNTTGALARTTASGIVRGKGTYNLAEWDGKNDLGQAVNRADHHPIVQVSRVSITPDGIIGNSSDSYTQNVWKGSLPPCHFAGCADGSIGWVQNYNERETYVKLTPASSMQAPVSSGPGDITETGCFIADEGDTYLVAVNSSGYNLRASSYIRRRRKSDGTHVPFSAGTTAIIQAQGLPQGSYEGVAGLRESPAVADDDYNGKRTNWLANELTGLARNATYIAFSRKAQNLLTILRTDTGAPVTTLTLDSPGWLDFTPAGDLLVVTGAAVKRYTLTNGTLQLATTFSGLVQPFSVASRKNSDFIAIYDAAPAVNQLRCYNAAGVSQRAPFGQVGGQTVTALVERDRFGGVSRDTVPGGLPTDRHPDGSVFAPIAFLYDDSLLVGDQLNQRVQRFDANFNYVGQVAYLANALDVAMDANDPSLVAFKDLLFRVSLQPMRPGDQSRAQKPDWELIGSYRFAMPGGRPSAIKNIVSHDPAKVAGGNGRRYAHIADTTTGTGPAFNLEVELTATGITATQNRLPGYGYGNQNAMQLPDGRLVTKTSADAGPVGSDIFTLGARVQPLTGYSGITPLRGTGTSVFSFVSTTKNGIDPWPEKSPGGDGVRVLPTPNGRYWFSQPNQELTGAFHLGAVEPGGSTLAVRTHKGKTASAPPTDGAWPEPMPVAYGGYAGGNLVVINKLVYASWNGQNAPCGIVVPAFSEQGLLAATFGAPLPVNPARDSAVLGYVGNCVDLVGAGVNTTHFLVLPDESEHGGGTRLRVENTDKIELGVFPSEGATAAPLDAYAASATRAYPAVDSYTYETQVVQGSSYAAVCVVRAEAGYVDDPALAPVIIEGRNFRNDSGNCVHVYMPNGREVIIRNCNLASKGSADFINVTDNSRVTVYNCTATADGTQPIGTTRGRFFYAFRPRKVNVYNNYLLNTAGGKVEYWSEAASATDTLTWVKNRVQNICGGTGGDYRQALQIQHVPQRPGMEVAYNQIINMPGASRVEDNFNIGESSGTAASPLRIHHNYVRGAYPANPTDGGFTGTGMTTDAGGLDVSPANQPSYILAEYNTFVATMNAAMNIAAGHHNTYQLNKIVVAGVLADGTRLNGVNNAVAIFKGQNYSDAQFDYNAIVNNDIRVNKANGENPYYINANVGPNSSALLAGNTLNTYSLEASYADEQATFEEWKTYLSTTKIEVGVPTQAS